MSQKFTYQIGERVLTRCHGWGRVVGEGQHHMYPELGNHVRVELDTPTKGEDWVWAFQPLIDFRYLVTRNQNNDGRVSSETFYFRGSERAQSEAEFLRREKTEGDIETLTWIDVVTRNCEIRMLTMSGQIFAVV